MSSLWSVVVVVVVSSGLAFLSLSVSSLVVVVVSSWSSVVLSSAVVVPLSVEVSLLSLSLVVHLQVVSVKVSPVQAEGLQDALVVVEVDEPIDLVLVVSGGQELHVLDFSAPSEYCMISSLYNLYYWFLLTVSDLLLGGSHGEVSDVKGGLFLLEGLLLFLLLLGLLTLWLGLHQLEGSLFFIFYFIIIIYKLNTFRSALS